MIFVEEIARAAPYLSFGLSLAGVGFSVSAMRERVARGLQRLPLPTDDPFADVMARLDKLPGSGQGTAAAAGGCSGGRMALPDHRGDEDQVRE